MSNLSKLIAGIVAASAIASYATGQGHGKGHGQGHGNGQGATHGQGRGHNGDEHATTTATFRNSMRDWDLVDVMRMRELNLNQSQGNRISAINQRAADAIRNIPQTVTGQARANRIRSIRTHARADIERILNTKQRSTMRSHGYEFESRGRGRGL